METLLTRTQVSETLGLSLESIRRLARSGVLPPIKLGSRSVRYRATDVWRLAQGGTHPPDYWAGSRSTRHRLGDQEVVS